MLKPPVEAVLINWKRPENVVAIVDALARQSVPCTITLCDCHPEPRFALPPEALRNVDRVYRLTHNLGAYSRYVPCAGYDHEYTYLADDDMVPGERCLEHFLDHARWGKFGVLGQNGRRMRPDGVYRTARVKRTRAYEEVDLVVRAYFAQTRNLSRIAEMRWDLGLQGQEHVEDDILLAVAMQLKAGLGCYLTPRSSDPETSIVRESLPSPFALSKRDDHRARRTDLFRRAGLMGWRPYSSRCGPAILRTLRGLTG